MQSSCLILCIDRSSCKISRRSEGADSYHVFYGGVGFLLICVDGVW